MNLSVTTHSGTTVFCAPVRDLAHARALAEAHARRVGGVWPPPFRDVGGGLHEANAGGLRYTVGAWDEYPAGLRPHTVRTLRAMGVRTLLPGTRALSLRGMPVRLSFDGAVLQLAGLSRGRTVWTLCDRLGQSEPRTPPRGLRLLDARGGAA